MDEDDFPIVVPGEYGFEKDKFTISAEHVALVRSGLLAELGSTVEGLCVVTTRADRETPGARAEWEAVFGRLERVRALLSLVGWNARGPDRDLDVDLARHREALLAALRLQVESEHGHAESLPATERERPHARIVALSGLIDQAEG